MEDMGQNNQMDLKIDAEFRNLLPEPTSEEYTNLEKSIVKRGVIFVTEFLIYCTHSGL